MNGGWDSSDSSDSSRILMESSPHFTSLNWWMFLWMGWCPKIGQEACGFWGKRFFGCPKRSQKLSVVLAWPKDPGLWTFFFLISKSGWWVTLWRFRMAMQRTIKNLTTFNCGRRPSLIKGIPWAIWHSKLFHHRKLQRSLTSWIVVFFFPGGSGIRIFHDFPWFSH